MDRSANHSPAPQAFADLRAFMDLLEARGELIRVDEPVDPRLEITEISRRLLAEQGPAVLFTQVKGAEMPVLANLFGTQKRVALAVGRTLEELEELGAFLADLRQPEPPTSLREAAALARRLSRVRHMRPTSVKNPPCQDVVLSGPEIDLTRLPIQTCWPGDAGPLITWPVVITRGPDGGPVNLGIYRMQLLGKDRLIMRWLRHRGGAQHAREALAAGGRTLPVAVAIGCDPGTLLAAVTPVPESLSEYAFAGLLRNKSVQTAPALTVDLPVPANAEIILEGVVDLDDLATEGPFGDHTGYYNEEERFPVFTVRRITMRRDPIYLTTFTGRPPDEPAILALALNRVFVPLLKKQFPEISDFHLSMEACSYRVAVVSIKKGYPGHAFRVMAGIWGFLRQFLYTKYIFVVDAGVRVGRFTEVMRAVGRHVHPARDFKLIESTPIDYLDFASPQDGLGAKLGVDATTKIGSELDAVAPIPLADPGEASDWHAAVMKMIPTIQGIHQPHDCAASVLTLAKGEAGDVQRAVTALWRMTPLGVGADRLWVVDGDITPDSWADLLWALATRSDPGRDLIIDRGSGRFALDLTNKLPAETRRGWGRVLTMDDQTQQRITDLWPRLGLPGSGLRV